MKTRTRIAHEHMKSRCDNPNYLRYHLYGGRGISYTPLWAHFNNFLQDMGECPEAFVLDRIDNSKGYSKDNCRWVSKRDSARNRAGIKLDVSKVRAIKKLITLLQPSMKLSTMCVKIAAEFNVDSHTIRKIERGINWGEVV